MIVKMKKAAVFLRDSAAAEAAAKLRKAGLLHIMTPKGSSRSIEKLNERLSHYDEALQVLSRCDAPPPGTRAPKEPADGDELASLVCSLDDQVTEGQEELRNLARIEDFFASWGPFRAEDLQDLAEAGYPITIYRCRPEDLQLISDEISYVVLSRSKQSVTAAVMADGKQAGIQLDPVEIPSMGPDAVRQKRDELNRDISQASEKLRELKLRTEELTRECLKLTEELEFQEVVTGLNHEEPVAWLTGFIPADRSDTLKQLAAQESWGVIITDPDPQEPVPTMLKNHPLTRMIEPVFKVLGTVPGYREYDISGLFLLFFTVFVAMIVGDAGYGLLFLGVTAFMHTRSGSTTLLTRLLYVLSTVTILWGAMTGTWFGSETIASWAPMRAVTVDALSSFPHIAGVETAEAQNNVIFICFVIGTIQLSIACLMNFFRDRRMLRSLAHLGWLLLIVGLYYLVLLLVLDRTPMPAWAYYSIGIGFALVVIFSGQEPGVPFYKGLLRGVGGLFTTFLDSISTFSNIISYIRLFAVGMATVAISSSFNAMASPMLGGVLFPAALLVLLIGHGMNIVMALLSVFVHGIRLNMLEFSGQLGMEWTGFPYAPFSERTDRENEHTLKE